MKEALPGAGLIITEGTFVSEQGQGWYGAPGIYSEEPHRAHERGCRGASFFYGNSATGYTDYRALPSTSFNVKAKD